MCKQGLRIWNIIENKKPHKAAKEKGKREGKIRLFNEPVLLNFLCIRVN